MVILAYPQMISLRNRSVFINYFGQDRACDMLSFHQQENSIVDEYASCSTSTNNFFWW